MEEKIPIDNYNRLYSVSEQLEPVQKTEERLNIGLTRL